jgi:pyrroloquinoline-quinone synthase
MSFSQELLSIVAENHLLKHPFYQDWNHGKLTRETLQTYARQYYHHVAAFPRYLSATHSQCAEIEGRQVLLENLVDEEKGSENHPELWLRFAESVGENRENVKNETLFSKTEELIETFMNFSRSSYAEGLGALFAYESQVPEVAASKIEGLQKFYKVTSQEGLKFFDVHLKADVYHTEAVSELLEKLTPEEKIKAKNATVVASKALWGFLDGIQSTAA